MNNMSTPAFIVGGILGLVLAVGLSAAFPTLGMGFGFAMGVVCPLITIALLGACTK